MKPQSWKFDLYRDGDRLFLQIDTYLDNPGEIVKSVLEHDFSAEFVAERVAPYALVCDAVVRGANIALVIDDAEGYPTHLVGLDNSSREVITDMAEDLHRILNDRHPAPETWRL